MLQSSPQGWRIEDTLILLGLLLIALGIGSMHYTYHAFAGQLLIWAGSLLLICATMIDAQRVERYASSLPPPFSPPLVE